MRRIGWVVFASVLVPQSMDGAYVSTDLERCLEEGRGTWVASSSLAPVVLSPKFLKNWAQSVFFWGQCERSPDALRWEPDCGALAALARSPTLADDFCEAFGGASLLVVGTRSKGSSTRRWRRCSERRWATKTLAGETGASPDRSSWRVRGVFLFFPAFLCGRPSPGRPPFNRVCESSRAARAASSESPGEMSTSGGADAARLPHSRRITRTR